MFHNIAIVEYNVRSNIEIHNNFYPLLDSTAVQKKKKHADWRLNGKIWDHAVPAQSSLQVRVIVYETHTNHSGASNDIPAPSYHGHVAIHGEYDAFLLDGLLP